MSFYTGLFFCLAIIFGSFSLSCMAYKSCSSLEMVLFTQKTIAKFSDECVLHSSDSFKANLPLLSSLDQSTLFKAVLELSSIEHQIQFSISTKPQDNKFDVKFTNGSAEETYSIPKVSKPLIIEVIEGVFRLSFAESDFQLSYKLNPLSPYTLAIRTSSGNPSFQGSITKTQTPVLRVLAQCPDGFFLVDGRCVRVCPSNFYRSLGLCFECPNTCNGSPCVSGKKCNPCNGDDVYWEQSGTCHEKCPETYFQDIYNNVCIKCAEGCVSCSYPNGLCNANYFRSDIVINVTVSVVLLFMIIICACCWNKKKKDEEQDKEGQPDQEGDQNNGKPKSDHINKMMGGVPVGPYNVLPENFENDEEFEGNEDEFHGRRKKKRLTDFAQSKLLTISMSKPFEVDDSNEDKAISHGSALLATKHNSLGVLTSKADSPLIFRRRKSTKKHSRFTCKSGSRSEIEINVDDTLPSPPLHSGQREFSPIESMSANKDALSFLYLKNCAGELSPGLPKHPLESHREEVADNVKTVEEAEEAEEREEGEEENEEDKQKKEGYNSDNSLSMSKDREDDIDLATCTICGMNKRDCVNRPCGHVVGCYACMEQFKESYAVCPRCKLLLTKLEKIAIKKKKK